VVIHERVIGNGEAEGINLKENYGWEMKITRGEMNRI